MSIENKFNEKNNNYCVLKINAHNLILVDTEKELTESEITKQKYKIIESDKKIIGYIPNIVYITISYNCALISRNGKIFIDTITSTLEFQLVDIDSIEIIDNGNYIPQFIKEFVETINKSKGFNNINKEEEIPEIIKKHIKNIIDMINKDQENCKLV